LIIELKNGTPTEVTEITERTTTLLGHSIPHYTLITHPNRDLALLTDTLVRQHLLKLKGIDTTAWLSSQQPEITG